MIRLSDLQWERIRHHFPEENIADGRPGRRPVSTRQVLEGRFGYSTPARNGTCSRSAIRTTKRFIAAFRRGAAVKFCVAFSWTSPTNCASGVLDEEECFIDATFVMAKGGGAEVGPTKRGKGMKIMAIVDRHGLPHQHPRREPSRSAPRTIVLRLLHGRSQAGKSHRRPRLRQ
jgi:hypothetical protein